MVKLLSIYLFLNLQVFFIFTLYNTSNHNDQLKVR